LKASEKFAHTIAGEALFRKITVRAEMSAEGDVDIEIFNW
jgi:hypothetical protein